jgi:tripartite-type tricarboxylate transporter receptor subunit TctC
MLAAVAGLLAFSGSILAQDYPQKPIRLIVPFSTGGLADQFARALGQKLNEAWSRPVIIENRTGAGGNIGADLVAKAPPDGYTLVMGNLGTHAVNEHLFKNMPFDAQRDFAAVALVLETEGLLVVNASLPVSSVKELLQLAKKEPGKLTYGSGGPGTSSHLTGELFKHMGGVDITHVPYKGNALALTDLLGGQVSMAFPSLSTVLPHVRSGNLKALATIGATRSPAMPDLPTVAEAALPGFKSRDWIGIFAPAGTTPQIVAALNSEIVKAMGTPEMRARLESGGARSSSYTPEQFSAFVRSEREDWAKVIRQAGITAQ